MARELRTNREICAEIKRLAKSIEPIASDGDEIEIEGVIPLVDADERGCNWTLMSYVGAAAHRQAVEVAVLDVMGRWNLRP